MKILASGAGIETATRLSNLMGAQLIRNAQWDGVYDGPVFNWGVARPKGDTFNYLSRLAGDKIATIGVLQLHNIPTIRPVTLKAGDIAPCTILCRATVHGKDGEGLVLIEQGQPVPPAVYYTAHYPNMYEFRLHVVAGKVLYKQRKVRRNGSTADMRMRVGPDFVWQINNLPIGGAGQPTHEQLDSIALASIKALMLNYGAVDVLYNRLNDTVVVCEINSAPELLGVAAQTWATHLAQMV